MTILNRKLWVGFLILAAVALVSSAAVVGGIEWALASLGAMALIGMIGISIYMLTKVLRYSKSLKGGCLEYSSTSAASCDDKDFEYVTFKKPLKVAPISNKDQKLIMEHIGEFFETGRDESGEKPAEVVPISEEDKRLIMEHIGEFFETGWEQSQEMLT